MQLSDNARAQECVSQQETIRTLEKRLDNQERMITVLLSYLGHGGPGANSSNNDKKKPRAVDNSDLAKKSGTFKQDLNTLFYYL